MNSTAWSVLPQGVTTPKSGTRGLEKGWQVLKVLCHSSQAGGSRSCPPALPPEPCPSPTCPSLPWGSIRVVLGVPVLLRVTLQAGLVTASIGLA